MIVMKFGGATVQDAACIENVASIVRDRLPLHPVIVISAMGRTTRGLLEAAVLASAGSGDSAIRSLDRIHATHDSVARALVPDWEKTEGFMSVQCHFGELAQHLNGISILRELSPQSQDKVLSYGELIATAILQEAFLRRGIPSVLLDARGLMITDDHFTRAAPICDITFDRIRSAVSGPVRSGQVPILQGFIGAARSGHTTTLGFEGSDYTAALAGSALNTSEIQIWKEVPGMMTADPDIVPRALKVKAVSYEEAAELTWWGAKVLHPKAVEPAVRESIPIRILCTKHPESSGTLIAKESGESRNPVKSIAYTKPVQLLRIHTERGAAEESIPDVMKVIRGAGSYAFRLSACGSRLVLTISPVSKTESLLEDLRSIGVPELVPNLASIALVGSGLRDREATVEPLIRQIAAGGLHIVDYGSSPIACTFVVPEAASSATINRLHDHFFNRPDPDRFE
jgi:aspartate kinase